LKQSSSAVIFINVSVYTPFDDSLATQFAESLPPTITSFTFLSDGSSVTLLGIRSICRGLANLTNLEMLVLYDNSIDDETCFVIADAFRNNVNVRTLHLSIKKIDDSSKDYSFSRQLQLLYIDLIITEIQ